MVPLKQYNTQSTISLEILKQCSLNLAPEMYITKETKWYRTFSCHGNSYAVGSVLIKAKISRFYLKEGSSTPNILMGRVKTIWELCVFRENNLFHLQTLQRGQLLFQRKRLEPRVLPWQQHSRCHFVSFVMYFSGAKFEEHCSNISGDILDSVFHCLIVTIYEVITFLICIMQKRKYL